MTRYKIEEVRYSPTHTVWRLYRLGWFTNMRYWLIVDSFETEKQAQTALKNYVEYPFTASVQEYDSKGRRIIEDMW